MPRVTPAKQRSENDLVPDWLIPVVLALLAVVLGAWRLGEKSLWLDEAFSWTDTNLPWSALLTKFGAGDTHQAAYFLLLKLWRQFGDSEACLRWPSVLAGASIAPLVWGIGREVLDRRAALIGGLSALLHPLMIQYAQEARGYTLATALSALSSLLLIRLMRQPRPERAAVYALVIALAVFTQLHAAVLLLVHGLALALAARRSRPVPLPWFAGWLAAALLASPAVVLTLGSPRGLIDWIEPLSWEQITALAQSFAGGLGPVWALACAALGLAGGWSLSRPGDPRQRGAAGLVVLWASVPILAVIGISLLRPMLLPRYLLFALPAWCLLVAAGVCAPRRRVVSLSLAMLLLVGEVYGLHLWFTATPKEEWREAAATIVSGWQAGDTVTSYAWFGLEPLRYYGEQMEGRLEFVDLASDSYDRGSKQPPPHAGKVANLALAQQRVWVVLNHVRARGGGISPHVGALERLLQQRYRLVTASPRYGLMLQLWERRDPR